MSLHSGLMPSPSGGQACEATRHECVRLAMRLILGAEFGWAAVVSLRREPNGLHGWALSI